MDTQLISRINTLWQPIYPYLAKWIGRWCSHKSGWILELGPFSGGIGAALGEMYNDLRVLCLMPQERVVYHLKEQFVSQLDYVVGSLETLPVRPYFDLIISRGAFFFLTQETIKDIYRVLKPGAYALLGGGYGPHTPAIKIKNIAEESKELNYRLGKKWISREGLVEMVGEVGLEACSQIIEDGGLWLLLKKDSQPFLDFCKPRSTV